MNNKLPPDDIWHASYDSNGVPYYINHTRGITQYEVPNGVVQAIPVAEASAPPIQPPHYEPSRPYNTYEPTIVPPTSIAEDSSLLPHSQRNSMYSPASNITIHNNAHPNAGKPLDITNPLIHTQQPLTQTHRNNTTNPPESPPPYCSDRIKKCLIICILLFWAYYAVILHSSNAMIFLLVVAIVIGCGYARNC